VSKHFTALADLPVSSIEALLNRAQYFLHSPPSQVSQILSHKIITSAFFEPSTRTKSSFEMAAKRLGAQVVNFDVDNSSVKKGETLYDTLKTLEAIGSDALIIRHTDDRIFETLAPKISTPMLNAGAGKHEHPSQGLLDLFTLRQEFGHLKGLHIAILGDVKHSRVAGSMMLVADSLGLKISLCGPEDFMPTHTPVNCQQAGLAETIKVVDAVMCLRNQFERHIGFELSPEEYHKEWGLTVERAKTMKPTAIIMHPAPVNRGVEIADSLVEAPQSRIFKQMQNGVLIRMSILEWVIKGSHA
jgi:aspartate carbamoyltransferase catalytic subunit